MPSIFQITSDITELETLLDRLDEDSERTDEDTEDELVAYLAESEEQLRDKIDGYVSFYRHLEARAKARKDEAKHITDLARGDEKHMDRLKAAVRLASEKLERPKLEGHTRSITVSQSKKPAIEILDVPSIPDEFKEEIITISWKVDKVAIAAHIMGTGEVPDGVNIRKVVSVRFR